MLTVTSAEAADSIPVNATSTRQGSGFDRYEPMPAGPGAKFVIIKAHIFNNAKKSLDLTCSLPIRTVLIDDMQRNFDPIGDLYKVQGNPECNSQVRPGLESDMTWPLSRACCHACTRLGFRGPHGNARETTADENSSSHALGVSPGPVRSAKGHVNGLDATRGIRVTR
jgi:hypothetical protein